MTLPTISIANSGGATQSLSQVIAGQSLGIAAGTPVDLFDNGDAAPIGTASVAADGRWSSAVLLVYGANAIVARATGTEGEVATSPEVDFDLEPVLSSPSSGQSVVPSLASTPADEAHARHIGPHAAQSRFVFGAAPGQVLITDFHLGGLGHDVIDLPSCRFASLAAALHHVHDVGGDAVIALGPHSAITIEGVTAADLRAHPHDLRLHG